MNIGFFGVQFSFALQQSNMSSIYTYLGAEESQLPLLWLAGPMTGLIVQPIIGAMSDNTWSPRFGRRKPYFLFGAIIASIALIFMPHSSTLWMAAGLLWILDAGNNIALEPYRAFVADKLPEKQHSLGFLMQSFFTGLGSTLANFTPAILIFFAASWANSNNLSGGSIPNFVVIAFSIGAFVSIVSILITIFTTPEYPPSEEQLMAMNKGKGWVDSLKHSVTDMVHAFKEMPLTMKQLIPVKFFTWFAMFCYWQYLTLGIADTIYYPRNVDSWSENKTMLKGIEEHINEANIALPLADKVRVNSVENQPDQINNEPVFQKIFTDNQALNTQGFSYENFKALYFQFKNGFKEASAKTGNLNGTYNIVCFLIAFVMVYFARRYGPKYVHFVALTLAGLGFLAIPLIHNDNLVLYLPFFLLGIAWASMLAMPYQMLAGAVPAHKNGVYMGIFNMFIVIPMMIQIFSVRYFVYDMLGSNPLNIIRLAGIFLILGGLLSLRVTIKKDPAVEL